MLSSQLQVKWNHKWRHYSDNCLVIVSLLQARERTTSFVLTKLRVDSIRQLVAIQGLLPPTPPIFYHRSHPATIFESQSRVILSNIIDFRCLFEYLSGLCLITLQGNLPFQNRKLSSFALTLLRNFKVDKDNDVNILAEQGISKPELFHFHGRMKEGSQQQGYQLFLNVEVNSISSCCHEENFHFLVFLAFLVFVIFRLLLVISVIKVNKNFKNFGKVKLKQIFGKLFQFVEYCCCSIWISFEIVRYYFCDKLKTEFLVLQYSFSLSLCPSLSPVIWSGES